MELDVKQGKNNEPNHSEAEHGGLEEAADLQRGKAASRRRANVLVVGQKPGDGALVDAEPGEEEARCERRGSEGERRGARCGRSGAVRSGALWHWVKRREKRWKQANVESIEAGWTAGNWEQSAGAVGE